MASFQNSKTDASLPTLLVLILIFFSDGLLYGLTIPLIPCSPAKLSESWMLGLVYAAYAAGVVFATPLFGIVSDRLGRRKPAFIVGSCFELFAVVEFAFATSLSGLVFARFAQGLSSAITWTLGLALIAELYSKNRAQMMGYAMLANVLGLVVGPSLGGFLLNTLNYTPTFGLAGLYILTQSLCMIRFLKESPRGYSNNSEFLSLLRDKKILGISAIVALGSWCWCEIEALVPEHLEHFDAVSPASVGFIFTVSNITYGISCPIVGYFSDRYGSGRTTLFGLFLMALLLIFLIFTNNLYLNGFVIALIGIACGFAMNPTLAQLGDAIDERKSTAFTAIYAIYNMAYSMGMIASSLAAGAIASTFSYEMAIFFTSLVIFVALPVCFLCLETNSNPNMVLSEIRTHGTS